MLQPTMADVIKRELCELVEARRLEINAGIRGMTIKIECHINGQVRVFDIMERERRKEERTDVSAKRNV